MGGLGALIAKRVAFGIITIIVISILIAVGVEALPGDLAQAIPGQSATPENVAAFRKELGLDKPLVERYFTWLTNFLQGDMGTSLANKREISELIGTRLGNTLFLAAVAAVATARRTKSSLASRCNAGSAIIIGHPPQRSATGHGGVTRRGDGESSSIRESRGSRPRPT